MGIEFDFFYDQKDLKDKDKQEKEKKKEDAEKQGDNELKQKVRSRLPILNENPNKKKIEDPSETMRDAWKIASDAANGIGKESIPSLKIDNLEIVQSGNNIIDCTFQSTEGDVNIRISNFEETKEGEQEKDLSITISGNIQNIPELKKEFPNGISNPLNREDKIKLLDYIGGKVQKKQQDIHANQYKMQKDQIAKQERESQKQDNLETIWTIFGIEIEEEELLKNGEVFLDFITSHPFDKKYNDERIALLSLGILLRHFRTDEINDMLKNQYEEKPEDKIQRDAEEKNMFSGEQIINYLSENKNLIGSDDLVKLIANYGDDEDYIIMQNFIQYLQTK